MCDLLLISHLLSTYIYIQLATSESASGSTSGPSAVMVGKSSRAPLVRLREGMLLEICALSAKNIHDPPSRVRHLKETNVIGASWSVV